MSWSYDPTDLNTTTESGRLNTVRLLIGDTETLDQQLQDEEIVFALSQNSDNVYKSGSWLCKILSAKFSRLVDTDIDGLSSKYSSLSYKYQTLSETLDKKAKDTTNSLGVIAGGIKISDIESVRADTDRTPASFRRDQFRNPPSYSPPDYE